MFVFYFLVCKEENVMCLCLRTYYSTLALIRKLEARVDAIRVQTYKPRTNCVTPVTLSRVVSHGADTDDECGYHHHRSFAANTRPLDDVCVCACVSVSVW